MNNTANISLDIGDRNQLHGCGSSIKQSGGDYQEREEKEDSDGDESDDIHSRTPGRSTGLKNKIYEGVQKEIYVIALN